MTESERKFVATTVAPSNRINLSSIGVGKQYCGGFLKIISLLCFVFLVSCATEAPDVDYTLASRKFQGIPSMAISNSGRLWATWYAGTSPAEDKNNYVVVATSGDGGKSWTEKFVIDPDAEGPKRAYDPELWIDPDGRLWSFWSETIGHDGTIAGVWAKVNSNPDKADSKWSEPKRITDGIMMCKPTVLSTGEWIFPVSTWRDTDNSARVIVTTDKGDTFNLQGACNVPVDVRNYDEHIIVERKDSSLWMLVRTSYGIGESISNDSGKTWSDLTPTTIGHPSARFFIRRLQSGNLLLVKHGPINERIGRSLLTAYISKDDGANWLGGLLLDERDGVSYPDGQQKEDGTIHVVYDYSRTGARAILMATFTEEDVISGNQLSATVSLRMIISKFWEFGFDSKKIFIDEATVDFKPMYDGSKIRYTTDGTEPEQNSLLYTKPFNINKTTRLKVREYTSDGLMLPVYDANYIKEKPIKPASFVSEKRGLNFQYFKLSESIGSTADLQKYEPTVIGEVEKMIFPYKDEDLAKFFGIIYSGYIEIPKDDVYTFSVISNDGSRLSIADKLVVDNDGSHGATEKGGEIALQKGFHKIELSYFQSGGGKALQVFIKSDGREKTEIEADAFHL